MKAQLRRKSDCSLKVISRQPSARCKWQNSAPLAVSAVNSFISQCFNVMKCLFIIRLRTAPVGTEGRVSGKRSPAPQLPNALGALMAAFLLCCPIF